jgi:hypothetical protein
MELHLLTGAKPTKDYFGRAKGIPRAFHYVFFDGSKIHTKNRSTSGMSKGIKKWKRIFDASKNP